jgi:tetraacyldisaccharide 4'-kinase
LDAWFGRIWMRSGPVACLLLPVSWLFGLLSALRRFLYRKAVLKSERLPVPVIVVGNVFVGGTGKTPLTIWLVLALQRAGFHPGVVSRGHGAQNDGAHVVTPTSSPQQAGDEPLLIVQHTQCPLVVGRNRVAAGKALLAAYPQVDVIVSDDGLQHYALQRDIEIVLFDDRGVGNGWLLPAGPLREPASRRRDFTVINAALRNPDWPAAHKHMQLRGEHAESLTDCSKTMPLAALQQVLVDGKAPHIVAAAGIGNPERFFCMLRDAGLVFDPLPLPDHFNFSTDTFADLSADLILITEKDAVKCRHIAALKNDPRLWVVPVSAHLDGALAEHIVEKLRGHPTA